MPRLRHRRAALFATLVAVALGAALASACGGLFETALRLDAPPSPRLAAYDAVVAPAEHATLAAGDGKPAQQVTLVERGTLPAGTLAVVRAVPGVSGRGAVRDLGVIGVKTRDVAALQARRRPGVGDAASGGGDARRVGGVDRPHRRRSRAGRGGRRGRRADQARAAVEHLRRARADRDGDPAGDRSSGSRSSSATASWRCCARSARRRGRCGGSSCARPCGPRWSRRSRARRLGPALAQAAVRAHPGRRRGPRRAGAAPEWHRRRRRRARRAADRPRRRRARGAQGRQGPARARRSARPRSCPARCIPVRVGRCIRLRRGCGRVRWRHAVHVTRERRRDRRWHRAGGRAGLRARRAAADRAARGEAAPGRRSRRSSRCSTSAPARTATRRS